MRFFRLMILLVLGSYSVSAADTTNISKNVHIGAFGGFGFNYIELAGYETLGIDLQAGVIMNHWLSGGVLLNAFFTIDPLDDFISNNDASLMGGYGGLFISPILFSNSMVHVDIPLFVGYGIVGYELFDTNQSMSRTEDSDQFWIFKPGIEVEINLLRFFRVAVGGYYQMSSDIKLNYKNDDSPILPKNSLNRLSVGITLRFGKF